MGGHPSSIHECEGQYPACGQHALAHESVAEFSAEAA